jgi:hypothetical protein
MNAQRPFRPEAMPESPARKEHAPRESGFAAIGPGHAYNEEAFRYFLGIERKRSERSGAPLLLLLVDLKGQPHGTDPMDTALAESLFAMLSQCLRETDFVGWYHQGRVIGAVLMQRKNTPAGVDASLPVRDRIVRVLGEGLPAKVADRLQVRVFHLPSKDKV